ncbi:Acyl-CoA synthetase, AMP-(fatty) acid ligase / (3R)-hydroxymyristoyl-[ACP] dehydratase [Collimonas arenae]|uniref:Acyl-CoA synthetase, AMP-(Fatty) acid ligase / (3R)-hydroxymyristoyl-[ACP] dehydratase n=1 Tax=Collimonas arenae TaxID=279058 RepID=A0A0A1FAW8_9BURK|nr:AMP-binding protein [Collimonas arenae]AIY41888.1 Acyl-CoA synthetase, AMP-(fatty) acid ligase / (3R)-hydroxymyristoyl-[ACP] dehydratase [Collimonas arenae]
MSESRNLLTLLSQLSDRDHGQRFAWRDGQPLNLGYFLAQVEGWRRLLERQAGSRFALYSSDSAAFASMLFGAWQAGKTVYLPGDVLPATCSTLSALVDGYLGDFPVGYAPLSAPASDKIPAQYEFKALPPDFPGLVIYTSGSTGEPQAVPKFLSQLATEVASLEQLFGDKVGDAEIFATVSHQHIYGLLFKVLWPITMGRAIHAQQINFLEELLPGERPAVLVSSPAHLKRLPAELSSHQASSSFSALRSIFSSGGPLQPEVAAEAGRLLGSIPFEVYGSSETGGIAWRQRIDGADDSWRVMPAIAWRVAANDDVLEIRSPHLPDLAWYAMADQVQALDLQRFRLKGRVDRIVKVEEKRISLDALERQLKSLAPVADARVLLLEQLQSQPQSRQRIAAFVVLSTAGREILSTQGKLALNRLLRDGMAPAVEPIALPRSWRYLDALPFNAQGKTTRADLLAMLEPQEELASVGKNLAARPTKPVRQVLEQESHRVLLELKVPADLLYFDGHFEGAPILPGVVQVDWAINYGREYFSLAPQFLGMQALKFQRVITPDMVVQLELLHDQQKSNLTFRMISAAGQHASGRINFGAGHAAD